MNFIKQRIMAAPSRGLFIASGTAVCAELAASAGFDWLVLDMEHGQGDAGDVLQMLRAMTGTPAAPLVRIAPPRSRNIQRALDLGAAGVVCPGVSSPVEAEALVEAMHYPPRGRRGLSRGIRAGGYGAHFQDYFARADAELLCVAQIENAAGLEAVDAIAAVKGVDVLFVGHSDLMLDLEISGGRDDPRIRAAEDAVAAAARKYNKVAGLVIRDGQDAVAMQERGFTFTALGTDLGCLRGAFRDLLA